MASLCNVADGRPAARPEGAPQAARIGVAALGKGNKPLPARRALIQTACGALHAALFMKVLVKYDFQASVQHPRITFLFRRIKLLVKLS